MAIEKYIGVDGCKAGWFFTAIGPDNDVELGIFESIENLWQTYSEAKQLTRDDIHDALANAVTAARLDVSMETLPPEPEPIRDMLGIPMQIVYSPSEPLTKWGK